MASMAGWGMRLRSLTYSLSVAGSGGRGQAKMKKRQSETGGGRQWLELSHLLPPSQSEEKRQAVCYTLISCMKRKRR